MSNVATFKEYLETTKLTFSYKMVLALVLLENVDAQGRVHRDTVIGAFRQFYVERQQRGLITEKERERHPSPMQTPQQASDGQVWQVLARYPLPLMEDFIVFEEASGIIQLKPQLWDTMRAADLITLKAIARQRLDAYYAALG